MLTYYLIVSITIFFYFYSFKKSNLQIISFSSLMYIFAIFFAILPGFMISKGTVFQERFPHLYRGFDIDVYFLFIFYTLLLPLGLYTGRLIVKNFDTKIPSRSHPNKRMSMIIFGIIIYSILYFNWLDSIPLISAISEGLTNE